MPSIEKRGANSWRLIVEDGTGPDGKRVQRRKTIKIEDDDLLKSTKAAQTRLDDYLRLELANFRREVESGQYIKPERTTFAEFIPVWKANYADHNMGAYTRRNYLDIINRRLIPAFGHMEMQKIRTMHLVSFMTSLTSPEVRKDGRDKPLATNTRLNIYKALKSVFDAAAKWNVVPSNPMDGVDRPTADKQEKRALRAKKQTYTLAESQMLITALENEPLHWRLYFLGVLLGGFRRGEMLGLEWPQVDFERGGIHVEKQISLDEDGNAVEAELKTEESHGFVPMPHWYMAQLADFRQTWVRDRLQQGDKWLGEDKQYLFHSGRGEMYYPSTATGTWSKFLDRHGLPHIRLHDLRHTSATLLREDGADLKSIQERLRHTKLSTTADLYTHESELVSRETADRLEKLSPLPIRSQAGK